MTDSTALPLDISRKDHVLWLTLNRPQALNALCVAMLDLLRTALADAATDPETRVVVITGAGRAFCAGGDLEEVLRDGDAVTESIFQTFAAIRRLAKPVIVAVNGIAAAGGLELLLCGDLVVAASSARIGDAHINFSLVPGGGSATILPLRIPMARAKALLFTGEMLPAQTLCDWGLVNWVVPDDELISFTGKLAERLAGFSPMALQTVKAMVDNRIAPEALRAESETARAHARTPEALEGLAQFMSRRAAKPA